MVKLKSQYFGQYIPITVFLGKLSLFGTRTLNIEVIQHCTTLVSEKVLLLIYTTNTISKKQLIFLTYGNPKRNLSIKIRAYSCRMHICRIQCSQIMVNDSKSAH